jgi:hypothetical protein
MTRLILITALLLVRRKRCQEPLFELTAVSRGSRSETCTVELGVRHDY